jgi:hypothetical protein
MANDIKASTFEVVDASGKVVLHIRNEGGLLQYTDGIVDSILGHRFLMFGKDLGTGDAGGMQNLSANVWLNSNDQCGALFLKNALGSSVEVTADAPPVPQSTKIAPGKIELAGIANAATEIDGGAIVLTQGWQAERQALVGWRNILYPVIDWRGRTRR